MIRLPLTACRRAAKTIRNRRVLHLRRVVTIIWTEHFRPSGELDTVTLQTEDGARYDVQGTTEVELDDDLIERDWQAARAGLMALGKRIEETVLADYAAREQA